MKIVIDTRNGIAGDIVSAGLIGLGADERKVISSMEYAAGYIGTARIRPVYHNDAIKLEIKMRPDCGHLHESRARELLRKIIDKLDMDRDYGGIATKVLDHLCEAERYVHSTDRRLRRMLHHHRGQAFRRPSPLNGVASLQSAGRNLEAVLHEAKDILIDVIGLSAGLQQLGVSEIEYLDYVNVGGGTINFSHGEFEVPAPATEYLLNRYGINWKRSNASGEMTTPTGASTLVGCNAKGIAALEDCRIIKRAFAQGTRGFPPVPFYLTE